MRNVLVAIVLVLAWLAPSPSAACPVNSPVDCGGYCCPTAYGNCCSGQCGASANCGATQDAAPAVLTCGANEAQVVANCGGDTCGCSATCGKNSDCASACCSRGRCVNACVCTGDPSVVGWSLCGAPTGQTKNGSGCAIGEDVGETNYVWLLPFALGLVSLIRVAKRSRVRSVSSCRTQ